MKSVISVLFVFIAASCSQHTETNSSSIEVKSAAYEGIIFSDKLSVADIEKFESSFLKKLPSLIEENLNSAKKYGETSEIYFHEKKKFDFVEKNIAKYFRRYRTEEFNGAQVVSVEALNKDQVSLEDCKNRTWSVDGGGPICWWVLYNVEKDSLFNFDTNADM